MSFIRTTRAGLLGLLITSLAAAAAVVALSGSSASGATADVGQPPPQWPENAGGWPS